MIPLLLSRFLLQLLMASVIGSGSYFLWSWLERKQPLIIPAVITLIVIVAALAANLIFAILVFAAFPCMLGSRFHKRLGGATTVDNQAFLMLLVATFSSIVVGALSNAILFEDSANRLLSSTIYSDWIFLFNLFIYPSMTPLLFCVWRNMKPRPGIDKHFDE